MFDYADPNGTGKGFNDYLNIDCTFTNVLKLESWENKNEHGKKDEELTFRDVLTWGDFLHEPYVHDSILFEAKPSDLDIVNEANDDDLEVNVAEEDLTGIIDNDDETECI